MKTIETDLLVTEGPTVGAALATLVPVTEEARRALGDKPNMAITRLPFKVGRENRSANPLVRTMRGMERRFGLLPQTNDGYLVEAPSPGGFRISSEHFTVDGNSLAGVYYLIDRNSSEGTLVGGKRIGGDRTGGRTELRHGDLIVLGSTGSPYIYRFELPL